MAELYSLPDEFDQPQGRWQFNAGGGNNPWDATVFFKNVYPESFLDFLDTQRHIDVRSFRYVSNLIPVPQFPDLDTVPQNPNLDTVFQTRLEVKPGSTFSENWRVNGTGIQQEFNNYWDLTTAYVSGDGVEYNGLYYVANTNTTGEFPDTAAAWDETFFVGKLSDYGGWYGMRSLADNANISAYWESHITEKLDISDMDYLSIVIPDYSSADLALSNVTLYSGDNGYASAPVAWDQNLSALPELRLDLTDFAATDFDLTQINGIVIYVQDSTPPANNTKITFMAIRAIKDTWVESALDFETRWGTVQPPVTLDGALYAGTVAEDFEFVRGDGGHFDPYPSDGAYTIFFYGGGEYPDALDPLQNSLGIIMREQTILGDPGSTLGKTAAGATPHNMSANQIYAVHVTTGVGGGNTSKVSWRIDGGGPGAGTAEFRALIYADAAGEPAAVVATSHPVQVSDAATAADIEFTLTETVTLAGSTKYWIAIHGNAEADSCRLFKDTVSSKAREDADTYTGGSPDPWDTAGDTQTDDDFTAFLTYSTDIGSAIYTWLRWNDAGLWFEAVRRDMDLGAVTETTLYSELINASGLDPTLLHAWTVKLVGKSLDSEVVVVDQNRDIVSNIWNLTTINSNDWTFRNGRVGFLADLLDRDAYVDAFITAPVGYALLRTKVYESRDPVDGVRLQAVYSPDLNMFAELTGTDAFRDQTKTTSGKGSIRTLAGLSTNNFIIEDWNETYLHLDIWTPATVTLLNQPVISISYSGNEYPVRMPPLKGAQWNSLKFELGNFKDFITGLSYSISILPGAFPDIPLGYFWVDNVIIGRRKVAWSVRANSAAPFRRFRGMANRADGAVHFNPVERGRQLQLEAQALTADAWISEFTLFPHYAELGLPVYDQGFETR